MLQPDSRAAAPVEVLQLADRLRRLSPSHRDPERFHEEKSEIEGALRVLARRLGNGRG